MKRKLLLAVGAVVTVGLAGCIPPLAPPAGDAADFWYRGSSYSYTVPAGVCSVTVDAYGAAGGSGGNGDPDNIGWGAQVQATIKVTPGEVLQVNPGGPGGDGESNTTQLAAGGAGGWNGGASGGDATPSSISGPWAAFGGGGGGGASDVRQGGADLANRVVIAGGGGGSGAQSLGDFGWGGDGGNPADDGGDGAFPSGGGGGGRAWRARLPGRPEWNLGWQRRRRCRRERRRSGCAKFGHGRRWRRRRLLRRRRRRILRSRTGRRRWGWRELRRAGGDARLHGRRRCKWCRQGHHRPEEMQLTRHANDATDLPDGSARVGNAQTRKRCECAPCLAGWRREWDLNPRRLAPQRFSRPSRSAAPAPLQGHQATRAGGAQPGGSTRSKPVRARSTSGTTNAPPGSW